MLINIILTVLVFISFCMLVVYLKYVYKQCEEPGVIELFSKKDIYAKNVDEDKKFQMSVDGEGEQALLQRNSVKVCCSVYFTFEEYEEYRKRVLGNRLP